MTDTTDQSAPGFTLYSSEKKQVSLSDLRGSNVLLLFFPAAFSGVCTAELCAIRDDIAAYNSLNAKVVAISVDSPYVLSKYKEDQNLNFTLLSDFNKEVSKAYDVLYPEFSYGMKGVAKRAAFVLDRNGIVQYREVLENAGHLPDFSKVKETLDRLN